MNQLKKIARAFNEGLMHKSFGETEKFAKEDKEHRDSMKEKHVDKIINDSFPASDPPSTY